MIVDTKEFQGAVNIAVKCLERKNTIPILRAFHLQSEARVLTIRATDQDRSVRLNVPSTGDLDVYVDGKTLTNIVTRLNDESLVFELVGSNLILKRKSGDIKLRTIEGNFPEIPFGENYRVKFKGEEFKVMCESALLGTSEDSVDTTAISNVAQLIIEKNLIEGHFTCSATDRHRFAFIKGLCDAEESIMLQMPLIALRTLSKTESDVELDEDINHIFVRTDNQEYSFRKIAINYPNVSAILNRVFDMVVKVDADRLRTGLELVAQTVDARLESFGIAFDKGITLSSSSAEVGEIVEHIDAEIDFEPFSTKYNINYILPLIRQMNGEIELRFSKTSQLIEDVTRVDYPIRIINKIGEVESSFDVGSVTFVNVAKA